MKLIIHSQAASHFNQEGLTVAASCNECKLQPLHHAKMRQFPRAYLSGALSEEDIVGEVESSCVDGFGEQLARYFIYQGKEFGLEEENFKRFLKLCEAIQRAIKPSLAVSRNAVENHVFAWVRDRFRDNTNVTLVEYILPKLEAEIADIEVWVPIAELRVESSVRIGALSIQPIDEELIDQWRDTLLSRVPNERREGIDHIFGERFRKQYQGWSASVIELTAEPIAARQLALRETKRSLAALRLFSVAALTPKATCYSAPKGQENVESTATLIFRNNTLVLFSEETLLREQTTWDLDNDSVARARGAGLDILCELLRLPEDKLTKFQESLISAITLYAEATRTKEISNKLVYLLAALEGIFLRNDSEPIQHNLAERMATLIGRNLGDKKSIIKHVKAVYGLRSAFLHHAHTIDDRDELEKFMFDAWRAMIKAIQNHNVFATKQDFASAIDDLKLSSPTR